MTNMFYGLLVTEIGICLLILTVYLARIIASKLPSQPANIKIPSDLQALPAITDAVFMVGAGGRILYSNSIAKEWFGYSNDHLYLERMAERIQPVEAFWGLCSKETKVQLKLDGRLVEGYSYCIPYSGANGEGSRTENNVVMLISLQQPNLTRFEPGKDVISQQPLDILSNINKQIQLNLDLEPTIRAILESTASLISADVYEILLFDQDKESLIPYRMVGVSGDTCYLEKRPSQSLSKLNFTNDLLIQRKPLLISKTTGSPDGKTLGYEVNPPFLSFLGIPLASEDEQYGTLELHSNRTDHFHENDLTLLKIISNHATIAVRNAFLFTREQKKVKELSGLNNLSLAMETLGDPHALYSQLVASIDSLIEVNILGFLIYSESTHILEAQSPFKGIPDPLLNLYRVDIQPESPAEEIILKQQNIMVEEASSDTILKILGLDSMAMASGVRSMILVSLKRPMNITGFIQVADRIDGLPFDQENVRLLDIISRQASNIIEASILLRESQDQSNRAETLHRVAGLTSSPVTLDEILLHSLRELARYLKADLGFIYLLNGSEGKLQLHKPSVFGLEKGHFTDIEALDVGDKRFGESATSVNKILFIDDIDQSDDLPNYYRTIFTELHANSAVVLPLSVRGQGIGEILILSHIKDHFQQNELAFSRTITSQITDAIEKHSIAGQSDEDLRRKVIQLETDINIARAKNVELKSQYSTYEIREREYTLTTQDKIRKLHRMRAALEIADRVDQLQDREEILGVLAEQVKTNWDMDFVLLADLYEENPRLVKLLGDVPENLNPQALLGQRNPLRTSLSTGDSFFYNDLDVEDWSYSPLLTAFRTKGFICLPIFKTIPNAKKEEFEGIDCAILAIRKSILDIHPEDADLFRFIGRQVTISLQNARQINEAKHRLGEMNVLLEFSRQSGVLDTEAILNALLESLMKVIATAETGMVAMWSAESKQLVPRIAKGYSNNSKFLQIRFPDNSTLPGKVFTQGFAANIDEVDFGPLYEFNSDQILLYRDATGGILPVSCLVVPLATFDTKLGVLALENFHMQSAFGPEDQAFVLALTHQIVLTLHNAQLFQAAEARALQLHALTQVASTITSSLEKDDLINTLLIQVRSVVPFDSGILWLREGEQMIVRATSGLSDIEDRIGLSVSLEDSLLIREMALTNEPISIRDIRKDERFSTIIQSSFLSWLGVPLLSNGDVTGVIVLEKTEPGFYMPDHIHALVTFASQASVALENANLYEDSLKRADELNERTIRLTMLNHLSTALSGSLDLYHILRVMTEEMLQVIHSSCISVVLLDRSGDLILHMQAPQTLNNIPTKMVSAPIFSLLRQSLGVFNSGDVSQETELGLLNEFLSQTNTVSLLIVPLITGNQLIGFTFVHAEERDFISSEEVSLSLTISNQVAAAIQNARLFSETERLIAETRQSSTELAALFDLGVRITQVLDLNRLMEIAFENINLLIKPDAVLVDIIESESRRVEYLYDHGKRVEPYPILRDENNLVEIIIRENEPLLVADIQSNNIPISRIGTGKQTRCWLGVPLVVRGVTNGILAVQSDQPNAFGEEHKNLLSQIANQLSVALDNAKLFQTVQNYTQELELRVSERTDQLEREHRRIQTMLAITTELSASLDLDTVLYRTLSLLNETIEAEHSSILLTQADNPSLVLRATIGYSEVVAKAGQSVKIGRNEGLAGWAIQNRQAIFIEDLHKDTRWIQRTDYTSLYRSAMVVPLLIGEEILGVLLVFHRLPNVFNNNQLELLQAIVKQIAIAINNTQLYSLIRAQAERLGDMLRTQHVETSRSQAILEAVADGVLVTDSQRQITLFNASAETILNLSRNDVLGKPFEQFTGLFGKAAKSWVQTIHNWSENPDSIESGETYEAQIELDNRRVVSVHLSPVQLRSDFLGTVSIFRDITHQVEVDRLKSEFVATVSHELRTPMTSIKGYVEILLMGAAGELNQQQSHYLNVVKTNTERLAVLVNDLLDISRIEAGKIILSLQPVDLRTTLDDVVGMISRRMASENKTIEINKQAPGDLPLILADPERIRQVLGNLLENAYQYTPAGGHIWITMAQEGRELRFEIRDDGIGIKPEEAPRIFERFYRGEDPLVLAASGTGLGLSIVHTLIQMHKGRIWFESEGVPGRGSTFSITIPVWDPEYSPEHLTDLKNEEISETIGSNDDEGDWIVR